ncbi:hypothetical protein L9F63_014117, partial [Diploptera punctata]
FNKRKKKRQMAEYIRKKIAYAETPKTTADLHEITAVTPADVPEAPAQPPSEPPAHIDETPAYLEESPSPSSPDETPPAPPPTARNSGTNVAIQKKCKTYKIMYLKSGQAKIDRLNTICKGIEWRVHFPHRGKSTRHFGTLSSNTMARRSEYYHSYSIKYVTKQLPLRLVYLHVGVHPCAWENCV